MKKYIIEKSGDLFNVKILISIDNGKTFHYCGNGKFFTTEKEAHDYIKSLEK